MPAKGAVSRYQMRFTFGVPLDYAFRWCTDYSAEDPGIEHEEFRRRILARSARRIVYEDLYEPAGGWVWSRQTVELHPPGHWRAVSEGNYRTWRLDYRLAPLGARRSELTWTGVRRPTPLGVRNPTTAAMEKEMRGMWGYFGRAMERDYRAGRPPRSPR